MDGLLLMMAEQEMAIRKDLDCRALLAA